MAQLIGITGGIGSGKTTIAEGLQALGYAVYFTDNEAKRLLNTDEKLIHEVKSLLGEEAYSDGAYNTQYVAEKVFNNAELLQKLNALVHPAVFKDLQQWVTQQNTVCFVESAILYESSLDIYCDKVIAITAPEPVRIQRTIARDHTTIAKVKERIMAQLSDNELSTRAAIVFYNDGIRSVDTICQQIIHYIMENNTRTYHCNDCGNVIYKHEVFCSKCGKLLDRFDFAEE